MAIFRSVLGISIIAAVGVAAQAATISGRVLDIEGKPVMGAAVTLLGLDRTTETDKGGWFELDKIPAGSHYLFAKAPSSAYLDTETRRSLKVEAGTSLRDVQLIMSGRPGDGAEYVGMEACKSCHEDQWPGTFAAFDGSPLASAHSRFVHEGTGRMIYPELWPAPGQAYLPRDGKGKLLMVQDPADGEGLVNLVLCTEDGPEGRRFLFKFYPEKTGDPRSEADLDASRATPGAVFIPVAGTIGGQGNWGEGYTDPRHETPDRYHHFGEGKQRFLARVQDVPYLRKWMEDNGVPVAKAKQDYVAFLPVYIMQDGTPVGSPDLAPGDVGTPKFWQKGPTHWCPPTNTLSRGCAGCHATGVRIQTRDVPADPAHPAKSVVTAFDYKDLNITCERCHGPGSEHAETGDMARIISPAHLTVKAENELCGQCHGSHSGNSERPLGIHKYPFDAAKADGLGHGFFVPGVHDFADFYHNPDMPSVNNKWQEGTYNTWPDQIHARAHSMMLSEVKRSVHFDNGTERLTCTSCHDAHTLDGGPAARQVGEFEFSNAAYWNNTLCLTCHAGRRDFAAVQAADLAVLQQEAGLPVTKEGAPYQADPADALVSRSRVAKAIAEHMEAGCSMGGALYSPEDRENPVGSCVSCHMAKIGKLFDLNDDAQYHLARDKAGRIAVGEGNVGNHICDIVWPAQSSVLRKDDPSKGHDSDIMPNSCSKCHAFARLSGDAD